MAKSDRGFASMDPEKQRRIASEGGKAAHAKGVAHEWTPEEAREAGRKGGAKGKQKRELEWWSKRKAEEGIRMVDTAEFAGIIWDIMLFIIVLMTFIIKFDKICEIANRLIIKYNIRKLLQTKHLIII